jgi:GNAT superfamily N-acetyltransferase
LLTIHAMTAADIPLGMRLKQQAGWNQLEADWRRCLDLEPAGCFVAQLDDAPVGTVTTCIFGSVGWIAMMLVDATVRGRGVGRALMEQALAYLEQRQVHCVRLDATPLGRPLYEKLGFVSEYLLHRYEGVLPMREAVPEVTTATPGLREQVVQLDRLVSGADRGKLLLRLFEGEAVRVVEVGGKLEGYLTARLGARAVLIGPCMAPPRAGHLLFADACQRYAGQFVYLDLQEGHPAVALAREWGLITQRPLLRMFRGERPQERRDWLWASGGPEKG